MANQMNSSFDQSSVLMSKPSPSQTGGGRAIPGGNPALNTPATEGKIKTSIYTDPRNTPSLGAVPMSNMDSSFTGRLDISFNQAGQGQGGSAPISSSFQAENLCDCLDGNGRAMGAKPDFNVPQSNSNPGIGYGSKS